MSCWGVPAEIGPKSGFIHGVASFDPIHDAVIIWTRITLPSASKEAVQVQWSTSKSDDFKSIVASGTVETSQDRDFTVAVDVKGLEPLTRYYYQFTCGQYTSPIGRTKTFTRGELDDLIFATVSCANWGECPRFGYFHVYKQIAKVDHLDFVIQGGDYIYEYGKGYYPDPPFIARKGLQPENTLRVLADYRTRYACYRTDPDLQELHRIVPWITAWDDHEIADSAWTGGSEGFKGSAEEWEQCKHDALKAYGEWLPIRGFDHDNVTMDYSARTFQFGNLMTLITMENRVSNRSDPVDITETAFYRETAKKDPKDWDEDRILEAKKDLVKQLRDPNATLIGAKQVEHVQQSVTDSVAAGVPWQVLLSQTIMSQIKAPLLREALPLQPKLLRKLSGGALNLAMNEAKAGKEGAELARMYVGMGRYGVPMNPDAWDGFQAERERVLKAMNQPGANPIVLAGDSHNAWAHRLLDAEGRRLGVEFDGPAVTCIGAFEDIYSRFYAKAGRIAKLFPLYLFTPWIEDSLKAANPDTLSYCNLWQRGFMLLHVTHRKFHCEYHYVSNVTKKKYRYYCEATFEVFRNEKGHMRPGVRYLTVDGRIPKPGRLHTSALIQYTHDISLAMHKGMSVRR